MSSAERFPLMVFALLGGLFIVFSPYILSGLFVMLTDEAAKKSDKIPQEPRERMHWVMKSVLRGMWLYFFIVVAILLYDGWMLLTSLFKQLQ
jgi:sterol desaturase/sphingolipid hydroxylase (fatty acid hydroxylase superfamily)